MNLEDLKNTWGQEKIETTPEISLEKQKEIHLPLEKIRKNMKMELWSSLILFPILIIGTSLTLTSFLMILMIIGISAYYFIKFYTLYKKINTQNFRTYHSLLDLRYELVLNIELYKSYYLTSTIIVFYILSFPFNEDKFIFLIFFLSVIFLMTYIFGKAWLHEMYGKHIQKIAELVAEFNDEEDDFQYDRSFIKIKNKLRFLTQFQNYCQRKFGKHGNLIYNIIIILSALLLLALISFAIGFLVGYLGHKYQFISADDMIF